jgi:glutathione S-transferase
MAPHAALEEAGAEVELVRVLREGGVTVSPANYLELNPHGRVPALVEGDLVLYESAACVLHVADRFPAAGLAPLVGTPERAHFYRWLTYLTNTVQATFMHFRYPERLLGADGAGNAAMRDGAGARLQEMVQWIDGELDGRDYLLGGFSAADLYLYMVTRWCRHLEPKAWSRPRLGAHYARLSERPSVARMLAAQEIDAYPVE